MTIIEITIKDTLDGCIEMEALIRRPGGETSLREEFATGLFADLLEHTRIALEKGTRGEVVNKWLQDLWTFTGLLEASSDDNRYAKN